MSIPHLDVVDLATCLRKEKPLIIGGRYASFVDDFTPAQMLAVYQEPEANEPKNQFTVGIVDDVTFRSLPVGEGDSRWRSPARSKGLFFGLGADGTVGVTRTRSRSSAARRTNTVRLFFL